MCLVFLFPLHASHPLLLASVRRHFPFPSVPALHRWGLISAGVAGRCGLLVFRTPTCLSSIIDYFHFPGASKTNGDTGGRRR